MRHHAPILIILITIIIFVTVGCGDNREPTSSQGSSSASRAPKNPPKAQVTAIPGDVSYSVIDTSTLPGFKRSLDVRLNKKVSEATLRAIALELKSEDNRTYERTFIMYYLPDMTVGAGAWATTHFNPDLQVRILGLTAEEETKLVTQREPANREIIGRWLNESPFVESRITIFREEGNLFIEQTFKDGSSGTNQLTESKSPLGRRFDEVRSQLAEAAAESQPVAVTSAGRQFVQTKLLELDLFKSEPKSHQFGFEIGGTFNSWLKSVESKRHDSGFSLFEKIAVSDLQMLGLEYMKTKGHENDYTRYARKQIMQVIQEGALETHTDYHWVLDARGDLQIRDNEGLIATAKKIERGGG